jgi:DNA-binding transcriptional LysR family regulator
MYMVPTVNAPLPPLNALRAFEAAARLLSFTRAAHELHVTQTAVGHQMRVLEAYLGVRLFLRFPRRLALTPEGQAYARELGRVSDRIARPLGAAGAAAAGDPVHPRHGLDADMHTRSVSSLG